MKQKRTYAYGFFEKYFIRETTLNWEYLNNQIEEWLINLVHKSQLFVEIMKLMTNQKFLVKKLFFVLYSNFRSVI
jgi:hypothetical protein